MCLVCMMVIKWGFLFEFGMVVYGENQDEVFLGMFMGCMQNIFEVMLQKIDFEVWCLVEDGLNDVWCILIEKQYELEVLVWGLLEYEMFLGEEICYLFDGQLLVCDMGDVVILICGFVVFIIWLGRFRENDGGMEFQLQV